MPPMLKLLRKHEIYEVWNDWSAESIFIDHKPTQAELMELVKKKRWYNELLNVEKRPTFIKNYIHVLRLRPLYTTAPVVVKKSQPDPNRCPYCNGGGVKSDDSYSTFKCPWCGGTGKKSDI